MAIQYVETQNRHCPQCNRITIHNRNNSKANWLLHIVIGLVTCGAWLALILVLRLLSTERAGPWVCSVCGTSEKQMSFLKRIGVLFVSVIALFVLQNLAFLLFSSAILKETEKESSALAPITEPRQNKNTIANTNTPSTNQPTTNPELQPK